MEGTNTPWFPAWCIEFEEPVSDPVELVNTLIEHREDSRWMLLGHPTVLSDRHLWAAWLAVGSRFDAGTMVSNSIDGEFLRLISGTHQMKVAFTRAGLAVGDRKAWLIRLPEWTDEELVGHHPLNDVVAERLMGWLGAQFSPERPAPTEEGVSRLGLFQEEVPPRASWESACLTHIAMADLGI
jgi:tRNA threonylcarbamoyladenosine modification (KEOPS) complex Cgi121 subunit